MIAQYSAIEGRKTVVFFSEGFHQQNVSRELEMVEAAAAESYAVFYAFDLNRRQSNADQALLSSTTEASEIQARTEPLASLAVETDGAFIVDAASHLDTALGRIADQAQDYYLVGFTPSDAALSARGQYRRVSVRVKRAGAHVSARTGYAAPKSSAPMDRRRAIDAALAAPFAQQALRVDYTTYTLRSDNAGRARVLLSLEADLPVKGAANESADVVFLVRDMRDGRVVASGTDTMPLPSAAGDGSATGVGTYRVHFEIPPGAYMMRTVVREPGGLVGSADRKLDVRGLSGPDVTVGDLILGSVTGSLPVRARAYHTGRLVRAARGLRPIAGAAPGAHGDGDDRPDRHRAAGGHRAGLDWRADEHRHRRDPARHVRPAVDRDQSGRLPGARQGDRGFGNRRRSDARAGGRRRIDARLRSCERRGASPELQPAFRPQDVLNGDFVRSARAALRASTTPAALRATRGFELFAQEDYGSAAAELGEALKLDQTSAATAFVLGWAYEEAGRHREAIGAWRAAATIDPDHAAGPPRAR